MTHPLQGKGFLLEALPLLLPPLALSLSNLRHPWLQPCPTLLNQAVLPRELVEKREPGQKPLEAQPQS